MWTGVIIYDRSMGPIDHDEGDLVTVEDPIGSEMFAERGLPISDDELTALALATDPDDFVIDSDAEPFGGLGRGAALLPAWYMPAPLGAGSGPRGRRVVVVSALVLAMLSVSTAGLCVSYGVPEVGDRVSSLFG